jgi:hypothetical protein
MPGLEPIAQVITDLEKENAVLKRQLNLDR